VDGDFCPRYCRLVSRLTINVEPSARLGRCRGVMRVTVPARYRGEGTISAPRDIAADWRNLPSVPPATVTAPCDRLAILDQRTRHSRGGPEYLYDAIEWARELGTVLHEPPAAAHGLHVMLL